MRVSTQGAFMRGLGMMQRLQTALDHTQRQISSGRRILRPSDDPIAASRAVELRESLSRLNQFDRNSTIATNRLGQEEAALNSVNNVLQRVRELALQANNATQSNESRKQIAVEMRQQLDNLVALGNQKDGNSRYLFAGHSENVQPVTRMASVFNYNGDQGQRVIQIGEGRQIADGDSGAAVFFAIRNGNGTFEALPAAGNTGTGLIGASSVVDPNLYDQDQYTVRFIDSSNYEVLDSSAALVSSGSYVSGDSISFRGLEFSLSGRPDSGDEFSVSPSRFQDVFTTLDRLASTVEQAVNDGPSRITMNNGINASLLNIDRALDNILDIRTQVGSRLSAIENQVDSNGSFALTMQGTLANIEDLDYAEAISRLSIEVTTLEAAQQSFIRTQSLSLFNYF